MSSLNNSRIIIYRVTVKNLKIASVSQCFFLQLLYSINYGLGKSVEPPKLDKKYLVIKISGRHSRKILNWSKNWSNKR